jgi:hypothetical protein
MKDKPIPFAEPPKKTRRIDWSNPDDVRAVVIASLGFSNNCVRSYCALSDGQIGYRLKLAQSQKARKEFRDGTSHLAKQVIRNNSAYAETRIEKQLHKPHQTDATRKAA